MNSAGNGRDRPEPQPRIEHLRGIFLVHAQTQTMKSARFRNSLGLLNSPRADPLVLVFGEDLEVAKAKRRRLRCEPDMPDRQRRSEDDQVLEVLPAGFETRRIPVDPSPGEVVAHVAAIELLAEFSIAIVSGAKGKRDHHSSVKCLASTARLYF